MAFQQTSFVGCSNVLASVASVSEFSVRRQCQWCQRQLSAAAARVPIGSTEVISSDSAVSAAFTARFTAKLMAQVFPYSHWVMRCAETGEVGHAFRALRVCPWKQYRKMLFSFRGERQDENPTPCHDCKARASVMVCAARMWAEL